MFDTQKTGHEGLSFQLLGRPRQWLQCDRPKQGMVGKERVFSERKPLAPLLLILLDFLHKRQRKQLRVITRHRSLLRGESTDNPEEQLVQ